MIKFALRCDADHAFQSWFRDNQAYDDLTASKHVLCPICGSTNVEKALMAPAIVSAKRGKSADPPAPQAASPVPPAVDPAVVRSAMRELRDHLLRHSRDVGAQFAAEARRMHEGEAEQAQIHGQASADEVHALLEDGIGVMPLPNFPDDHN